MPITLITCRFLQFKTLFCAAGNPPSSTAERVIEQICEWTQELRIPQNLSEYGVGQADIPELAIAASKVTRLLNNNPKPVGLQDMERMYRQLLP